MWKKSQTFGLNAKLWVVIKIGGENDYQKLVKVQGKMEVLKSKVRCCKRFETGAELLLTAGNLP